MLMKCLVGYHLHQVDVIRMFMFPVLYLVMFSSGDALDAENEEMKGSAMLSVNLHTGSLGPSSSWSAKEPGEADEDASI